MSSSTPEHHVEEEELLPQRSQRRQPRASSVAGALAIVVLACTLCALAWSRSTSQVAAPAAFSMHSVMNKGGLLKAKKYDWKDSNMALFGSDAEKKLQKQDARVEPAWKGVGEKPGLEIWRINKFKVERLDEEDYGKFSEGDSYIVLNTYKDEDSDDLRFDVHFWIGKQSTEDEYGMAAVKALELDSYLDDKPVQHREVQGSESDLFKGYFDSLTIEKGGVDSGFMRKMPKEHEPHLFKVSDTKIEEVPKKLESLDDDHAFVLDMGLSMYQINGPSAPKEAKMKAAMLIRDLKAARGSKVSVENVDGASLTVPVKKGLAE